MHNRRVYRDHERADDNGRRYGDCPTNKSFKVNFCTVAHWNENGEIVEENLFYDFMGMLKQIGVM